MWACTHLHAWTLNLPHCLHQQLMIHILVRRQKCFTARIQDVGHWVCLQSDAWRVAATVCVAIYIYVYIYIFIYIYVCVHIYLFIYRKGRCQVPIFPRFWECSVFATSCSIVYVHIPAVMVLLKNPHRLSDFLRGCQRMSRQAWRSPGKRKEEKKHNVYIYIYGFPWGERWPRKKKITISFALSPLLALLCTCPLPDGLAFFLVVLLYASMIWKVNK